MVQFANIKIKGHEKLNNHKAVIMIPAIEDNYHPVIVMPLYSKQNISQYVRDLCNRIRFSDVLKLLFKVKNILENKKYPILVLFRL